MVIIVERRVGVSVSESVKEAVRIKGGKHEGFDRWAVTVFFRARVENVSLSRPGKSGGLIFLR